MRCEMKKQIKKIICFALFVVAYGCSSGQHVVDKEISLDELEIHLLPFLITEKIMLKRYPNTALIGWRFGKAKESGNSEIL